MTGRKDLSAFYRAVDRYGAPDTPVADSGSVFLANWAKAVYAKLGVRILSDASAPPSCSFRENRRSEQIL